MTEIVNSAAEPPSYDPAKLLVDILRLLSAVGIHIKVGTNATKAIQAAANLLATLGVDARRGHPAARGTEPSTPTPTAETNRPSSAAVGGREHPVLPTPHPTPAPREWS